MKKLIPLILILLASCAQVEKQPRPATPSTVIWTVHGGLRVEPWDFIYRADEDSRRCLRAGLEKPSICPGYHKRQDPEARNVTVFFEAGCDEMQNLVEECIGKLNWERSPDTNTRPRTLSALNTLLTEIDTWEWEARNRRFTQKWIGAAKGKCLQSALKGTSPEKPDRADYVYKVTLCMQKKGLRRKTG